MLERRKAKAGKYQFASIRRLEKYSTLDRKVKDKERQAKTDGYGDSGSERGTSVTASVGKAAV